MNTREADMLYLNTVIMPELRRCGLLQELSEKIGQSQSLRRERSVDASSSRPSEAAQ